MKQKDYTPGPYEAHKAMEPTWWISPVNENTRPQIIAQTTGGNDEANAHLLAAAPALLEALKATRAENG